MADILIPEFMDDGAAAELIAEYDVHWDPELWGKRDELIDNYAWRCVDDMDIKDLCRAMAEQIAASFDTESDDYLIEQVKEYYPDLLES